MTPRLSCRDLRVRTAAGRDLLHVPALDVPAGQTLAVLGPNGAGKSTLLRALGLLGHHRVTGQILLDGHPATPPRMRAAVAAVLQRPILRRGTVTDNVASGLRFHGLRRREARDRIGPWLDALGIAHLAARDARTLSGGEAQRVSIARALALTPQVLLLDEPFTGLDATSRVDLLADLCAALHRQTAATILVTHERHDALALAEDTALLIAGRIRRYGLTHDVLDHPCDPDTARLLGYTNLLPPAATGQPHPLAARPEHCQLIHHRADVPDSVITITGMLRRTVPLGAATRFDVDTPTGPLTCLNPGDPGNTGIPTDNSSVVVAVSQTRSLVDSAPTHRPGRHHEPDRPGQPGHARPPWPGAGL